MMNYENSELIKKYDIEVYESNEKTSQYLVVCHGFGDTKIRYEEYKPLFDDVVRTHSIVTFTFSFCEKKIFDVNSILEWRDDLTKIITWIKSFDDQATISLFGISLGAWVAALYCNIDDTIDKCIFIGPVFTLHMGMKANGGVALLYLQKGKKKLNDICVNKKFLESMIRNQPINLFIKGLYRTETFIFVGELDNIYRKADAAMAEAILRSKGVVCESFVVPGGRHFNNNDDAIFFLTQEIKRFFSHRDC